MGFLDYIKSRERVAQFTAKKKLLFKRDLFSKFHQYKRNKVKQPYSIDHNKKINAKNNGAFSGPTLILTCRFGESIWIDNTIQVKLLGPSNKGVRIGIESPDVPRKKVELANRGPTDEQD